MENESGTPLSSFLLFQLLKYENFSQSSRNNEEKHNLLLWSLFVKNTGSKHLTLRWRFFIQILYDVKQHEELCCQWTKSVVVKINVCFVSPKTALLYSDHLMVKRGERMWISTVFMLHHVTALHVFCFFYPSFPSTSVWHAEMSFHILRGTQRTLSRGFYNLPVSPPPWSWVRPCTPFQTWKVWRQLADSCILYPNNNEKCWNTTVCQAAAAALFSRDDPLVF